MTNERPTLYIGFTSDLYKRVHQHKMRTHEGFTKKYNLTKLVYYEIFDSIEPALNREKRLKKWNRSWKLDLIGQVNPTMRDLSEDWDQDDPPVKPWDDD